MWVYIYKGEPTFINVRLIYKSGLKDTFETNGTPYYWPHYSGSVNFVVEQAEDKLIRSHEASSDNCSAPLRLAAGNR